MVNPQDAFRSRNSAVPVTVNQQSAQPAQPVNVVFNQTIYSGSQVQPVAALQTAEEGRGETAAPPPVVEQPEPEPAAPTVSVQETEPQTAIASGGSTIAAIEQSSDVAPVPSPELIDDEPEPIEYVEPSFTSPHIPGDWRAAMKAVEQAEEAILPEPDEPELSEPVTDQADVNMPAVTEIPSLELPDIEFSPSLREFVAAAAAAEAPPQPPTPAEVPTVQPLVTRVVNEYHVTEHKTDTTEAWAKAELRYQTAILAKNKNMKARLAMQGAAERRNMTVDELADEIISKRVQQQFEVFENY